MYEELRREQNMRVTTRREYTDGILFVVETQKGTPYLMGEQRVIRLAKNISNVSIVTHGRASGYPCIRINGRYEKQKFTTSLPTYPYNEDMRAEVETERAWFKEVSTGVKQKPQNSLVKQGNLYIYGEYVLSPCQNAFNSKKSYWLSKKDFMLAVYCFTPIDRSDLTNDGILRHIKATIPLLEKAGFKQ